MPGRPVSLSQIPTLASLLKSSSKSQIAERISIYQGDITSLDIDAIVNAANTSLLCGVGVDGAIHRAAGKGLLEECRKLNGCETGDAKITAGHDLPARFVVHTVGPVYKKTKPEESAAKLESAYRRSLEEASQHKSTIKSIAFPSISTGVYGYPMKDATKIALKTVADFLEGQEGKKFERVVFCTFSSGDYKVYEELVGEVFGKDRAENM